MPYRIAAPEPPRAPKALGPALSAPEVIDRAITALWRIQNDLELERARVWAEAQERMFQRRLRVARGGSWKDPE